MWITNCWKPENTKLSTRCYQHLWRNVLNSHTARLSRCFYWVFKKFQRQGVEVLALVTPVTWRLEEGRAWFDRFLGERLAAGLRGRTATQPGVAYPGAGKLAQEPAEGVRSVGERCKARKMGSRRKTRRAQGRQSAKGQSAAARSGGGVLTGRNENAQASMTEARQGARPIAHVGAMPAGDHLPWAGRRTAWPWVQAFFRNTDLSMKLPCSVLQSTS